MKTKRFYFISDKIKKDGVYPTCEFYLYKKKRNWWMFIPIFGWLWSMVDDSGCGYDFDIESHELYDAGYFTEIEFGLFPKLWIRPMNLPIANADYELTKMAKSSRLNKVNLDVVKKLDILR